MLLQQYQLREISPVRCCLSHVYNSNHCYVELISEKKSSIKVWLENRCCFLNLYCPMQSCLSDVKVTLHSSYFVLLYLLGTKMNEASARIKNLHDTTCMTQHAHKHIQSTKYLQYLQVWLWTCEAHNRWRVSHFGCKLPLNKTKAILYY